MYVQVKYVSYITIKQWMHIHTSTYCMCMYVSVAVALESFACFRTNHTCAICVFAYIEKQHNFE